MKKLILMLTLVSLTLLATTSVQDPAEASCSGVNCGCDMDQAWCLEDCPQEGEPGWLPCHLACFRAYRDCARACCGGI